MLDENTLCNVDYEERLLAALVQKPDAIVDVPITSDDFYSQLNRVIYNALYHMVAESKVVSVQSAVQFIRATRPDIDMGHVVAILTKDMYYVPKLVNEYTTTIVGYARARQALKQYRQSAVELFHIQPTEVVDNINTCGQKLMQLTQATSKRDELEQMSMEFLAIATDELMSSATTGVKTGFRAVDRLLVAGINAGDLIILAGRPSMGKTAWALNLATHLIKQGIHVLFFSLETSKKQVIKRMLQAEACITRRAEGLNDQEAEKLLRYANSLTPSMRNMFICDMGGMSAEQIAVSARKNKFQHGDIGLIIVDHLQLMQAQGYRNDDRHGVVSHSTACFKALAKEMDCPVLALSQLSRRVEQRENKRPVLADLKESGSIEQDADIVLMLYRDYPYTKDEDDKYRAEMIVAKQKDGATGIASIMYLPDFMRFQDEPSALQEGLEMGKEIKGDIAK